LLFSHHFQFFLLFPKIEKKIDFFEEIKMTDIIVIMDESGSMSSMGSEPLQALNHFIEEQKKTDPTSLFTLYLFSTEIRTPFLNIPLSEVPEVTDYKPKTMTALYDCVDLAITSKMATERKENVTVVIITDGMDNKSHTSGRTIREKIANQESQHNWKFIYLAANQDAFSSAEHINISRERISMFDQGSSGGLLRAVSTTCTQVSGLRRMLSQSCSPAFSPTPDSE